MILHNNIFDLTGIHKAVVTTGSFDGVHVGHKTIIKRLNQIAKDIGGESVLITFYPHPRKILYPESEGKDLQMIYSQKEKISLLEQTGLDHLVIIPFTPEFSKTSSADFVNNILLEKLHAQVIVVGFNHYFGYHREGNYKYLHELSREKNFKVEEIPEQEIQHETVSSTKIRKALLEGNIQRTNAYLDHLYFIEGKLTQGNQGLANLGFDTYSIAIEEKDKLIPPEGVYAIRLITKNIAFKGMISIISNNKTYNNNPFIEFNLFENLDSHSIKEGKVVFYKRIRDIMNFQTTEELQLQLEVDKAEIEELVY
jgi:riboflavin kinase / FMN adenylyltransferase